MGRTGVWYQTDKKKNKGENFMSFEKYADLAETGFKGGSSKEVVPPEDEFFHSIYIAGQDRKNHINITEQSGKIQIRGREYNLEKTHMVITHTKEILCKVTHTKQEGEKTECFSYKEGEPPWYSTSRLPNGEKRSCPLTSAERALDSFCNTCRAQIIVAGIYCYEDGKPVLTEEKKPIFVFLRGKGMRYSNVSSYLGECFNSEFPPLFEPVTEESKKFEKSVVNNKRCVTVITKSQEKSSYGSVHSVFVLTQGVRISNEDVHTVLNLTKRTKEEFNKKFDWSKEKISTAIHRPPEGVLPVEDSPSTTKAPVTKNQEKKSEEATKEKTFSFDDINF